MKYEERSNINRYLSVADEKLVKIKGEPFAEYRRKFDSARLDKVRLERPIEVAVGLTSYCNLMCKMCYRNYIPDPGRINMSDDVVDGLVRQCKALNIASIWLGSFTEALLHPDICNIIKKFGTVEAQDYWFTTNATLLSEPIIEAMIDSGVTKLHISIDAAKKETYKKIRGANLDIVESNIHKFLELRESKKSQLPMLRLTFVEQDDNRDEVEEFVEKWKDIADIVDVQKMTDYTTLLDDSIDEHSFQNTFFDCYYANYQLAVTYDGKIWPCPCPIFDTNKPVYIQTTSLEEYWNSEEMKHIVNSMNNKSDYFECCLKCMSLKQK